MPDISKCTGEACDRKSTCFRFTCTPSKGRQVYFAMSPMLLEGSCDAYIHVGGKALPEATGNVSAKCPGCGCMR